MNLRIYPVALPTAKIVQRTSDATHWLDDPSWFLAANDDTYRVAANG